MTWRRQHGALRWPWVRWPLAAMSRAQVARALAQGNGPVAHAPSSGPSAVLVVRLEPTLGDNVLFTGALRALRDAFPDRRVVLVCHPRMASFWRHLALADRVEPYPYATRSLPAFLRRAGRARDFARADLRDEAFECALVPRVDADHDAALIAFYSGAPRRVGFESAATLRKAVLNDGFDRLLTEVLTANPNEHEVDAAKRLVAKVAHAEIPCEPFIPADGQAQARADERLRALGFDFGREAIALSLGYGSSALKRWPAQRFAELARVLVARPAQLVVLGTTAERGLLEEFRREFPGPLLDLVEDGAIEETAAILRRCGAFVGADTGCLHLAAAAGIPVVGLYGSSSVARFGPRGDRALVATTTIACSPSNRSDTTDRCTRCVFDRNRCMDDIEAARVASLLSQALAP